MLVQLLEECAAYDEVLQRGGDVFVLAQKIVSKSEGRMVDLATVEPSARAIELGGKIQKDPRLVEVILSESRRIVLAGHLDTVPIADNVPSHRDGDMLYGCGSSDMKSGVAVMLGGT